MSSGGLTPGDPLGGGGRPPPPRPESGDRPTAEDGAPLGDGPTAEDRTPSGARHTAEDRTPSGARHTAEDRAASDDRPPAAPERPPVEDRPGSLWSGDPAPAPERPAPGYTSPVPPGAGGLGLPAPAAVAGRPELAGWWRRVGAQVIDGLIVTAGAALLFVAITAPFSVGFFASEEVGAVAIIVGALLALLCVAVVALLYAPALMARTDGKTLGRMATGIRVVRTDGQPITFGFAMLREVAVKTLLVGTVSTLTGGIGYLLDVLWPLWDEENRALHDFVVNTRTILD